MPTLSAAPCHTCRKRHLKCDRTKPVCSRCRRLNKKCGFPGPAIRNGIGGRRGLKFPLDQPWIGISRSRLQFIDETTDLAHYYGHQTPPSVSQAWQDHTVPDPSPISTSSSIDSIPTKIPDESQTLTSPLKSVFGDAEYDRNPEINIEDLPEGCALTVDSHYLHDLSTAWYGFPRKASLQTKNIDQREPDIHRCESLRSPRTSSFENSAESSQLCHGASRDITPASVYSSNFWPLQDVQEAYLMRYFVDELAQWFDSCDLTRHSALEVPDRACTCPAILYAIFSASARHISQCQDKKHEGRTSRKATKPFIASEVALEYQNLCISHLMSLSGDTTEVQDENLLAAAVILRFYEELDVPLVGIDDETYLRGTQVFLEAQAGTAVRGRGLQNAAYWVGIRQEFHTAFIKQRAFRFNLSCCNYTTYKTLEPADDFTWANRVILHCAEALTYCYRGDDHNAEQYDRLWDYNQKWYASKPPTFEPIYYQPPDHSKDEVLPQIWYIGNSQVTAIQHWHLARILLAAFDPKTPRMGLIQKRAAANREAEIKSNVFRLCGIALSNKTAPGLITACMGVSMCGDRITDGLEQEAMLDILIKTEETHALPTGKAQRELKEAWDWGP